MSRSAPPATPAELRAEARRHSVRAGIAAVVVFAASYALRNHGPRIAEHVGMASEWRLPALLGAALPFLMAMSLGARMHSFREEGTALYARLLSAHRQATSLTLVSIFVASAWIYAIGYITDDDYLPAALGFLGYVMQIFRFRVTLGRRGL